MQSTLRKNVTASEENLVRKNTCVVDAMPIIALGERVSPSTRTPPEQLTCPLVRKNSFGAQIKQFRDIKSAVTLFSVGPFLASPY